MLRCLDEFTRRLRSAVLVYSCWTNILGTTASRTNSGWRVYSWQPLKGLIEQTEEVPRPSPVELVREGVREEDDVSTLAWDERSDNPGNHVPRQAKSVFKSMEQSGMVKSVECSIGPQGLKSCKWNPVYRWSAHPSQPKIVLTFHFTF